MSEHFFNFDLGWSRGFVLQAVARSHAGTKTGTKSLQEFKEPCNQNPYRNPKATRFPKSAVSPRIACAWLLYWLYFIRPPQFFFPPFFWSQHRQVKDGSIGGYDNKLVLTLRKHAIDLQSSKFAGSALIDPAGGGSYFIAYCYVARLGAFVSSCCAAQTRCWWIAVIEEVRYALTVT